MLALESAVPWGRSFEEYRRMFALTDSDLQVRILGCADGPASFNAELTAKGGNVVSCDPIYGISASQIRKRFDDASPRMIERASRDADSFHWGGLFAGPDDLAQHRRATLERFLADYQSGQSQGRYIAAELPTLPFAENDFDIALCSHFLFLYSDLLSEEFHLAAVRSLTRAAREVRVFPVTDLAAKPSRHVQSITSALREDGLAVVVEDVDYEFQRGANHMLRVKSGGTEATNNR